MASRRVEDSHISKINTILSSIGLECIRSPTLSEQVTSMSLVSEDHGPAMEEEKESEDLKPEVPSSEEEEESIEEEKTIFPTPSLRLMLTDKQRMIEKHNRIHVLPETFKTNFDPSNIPKIAITAQQKVIDTIAEMLGCVKYKTSLAEYWFLDTLANLLRRAQDDDMDRPTQAVLMLWFCEWMKEIQQFDAADRPRMLKRFQDNMLSAARYVANESTLPTPEQAGVRYLPFDEDQLPKKITNTINTPEATAAVRSTVSAAVRSTVSAAAAAADAAVTFDNMAYACSLRDLLKIMHYIFDLFSTDYQFDLVRSIFTYSPDYYRIDTPYQLQTPKRMYAPLKVKPKKEKSAKKDAKGKGKKKQEPDTVEFLALMDLKAKEEKQLDEQEEAAREAWNQKSHILPLGMAATSELFNRYWPPPTPEPPPPEPEIKPKKKKK